MDEIDKEALTRAIELTKAEAERAEQLESMLKDRSWEEVARFAARHQQCKSWEEVARFAARHQQCKNLRLTLVG